MAFGECLAFTLSSSLVADTHCPIDNTYVTTRGLELGRPSRRARNAPKNARSNRPHGLCVTALQGIFIARRCECVQPSTPTCSAARPTVPAGRLPWTASAVSPSPPLPLTRLVHLLSYVAAAACYTLPPLSRATRPAHNHTPWHPRPARDSDCDHAFIQRTPFTYATPRSLLSAQRRGRGPRTYPPSSSRPLAARFGPFIIPLI